MANNRLSLRNKLTGKELLIAKYYPSQGWTAVSDLSAKFDAFSENTQLDDGSMWGEHVFELEYEQEED